MAPRKGRAADPPATPVRNDAPGFAPPAPDVTICERCLANWPDDHNPACNASFEGSQTAKCWRCSGVRHGCVPVVDPHVVNAFNAAHRARIAIDDAEAPQRNAAEQAAVVLRAARLQSDLKTALGRWHRNKNKMSGGSITPVRLRATSSPAASGSNAALMEGVHAVNRNLGAMVEIGKEMLRNAGSSVEPVERAQGLAPEPELPEAEAEDEPEEGADEDGDGMED